MAMARIALLLAVALPVAVAASEIVSPVECAAPADVQHINPPSLFNATEFGFTQVVTVANARKTVYVSGQASQGTDAGVIGATLDEQADTATANVKKALEAVGATVDNMVHIQIFIASYNPDTDLPIISQVTNAFQASNGMFPSAEVIGVQSLIYRELRIEISAIAVLP